jgi:hypothetical protein
MAGLFESGRIVDLILLLMILEALAILGWALLRRARLPITGLLLNLAAGACLLLALRAVLLGSGWTVAGAWLAGALGAHVADLIVRLRGSGSSP